jgi:hypothetical protein
VRDFFHLILSAACLRPTATGPAWLRASKWKHLLSTQLPEKSGPQYRFAGPRLKTVEPTIGLAIRPQRPQGIQQAMQRFNEAYVKHLNTFTELGYKDDPAIVAMLTNENDLRIILGTRLR